MRELSLCYSSVQLHSWTRSSSATHNHAQSVCLSMLDQRQLASCAEQASETTSSKHYACQLLPRTLLHFTSLTVCSPEAQERSRQLLQQLQPLATLKQAIVSTINLVLEPADVEAIQRLPQLRS